MLRATKGSTTPRRTGKFPASFFDALNRGDDDEAMAQLRLEAQPDGETLTPRAAALVEAGEWDTHMLLSLGTIGADCCFGKVGNDNYRVCGRLASVCPVAGHQKDKHPAEPGWYIPAGGKGAGFFVDPHLPLAQAGGPIQRGAAGRITDRENPFKLTKGQWRFVMEAWEPERLVIEVPEPTPTTTPTTGNEVESDPPSGEEQLRRQLETVEFSTEPLVDREARDHEEPDPANASASEHPTREQDLEEEVHALRQHVEYLAREVADMARQMQGMLVTIQDVSQQGQNNARQIQNFAPRLAALELQMRDGSRAVVPRELERRVDLLEQAIRAVQGQSDLAAVVRSVDELRDSIAEHHYELYDSQGAVPRLRLQFTTFRDKLESGGGIECHGVKFSSKAELLAWYRDKNISSPAVFLDALAILHAIRAPVVHQDEASKQREIHEKVKFTSMLDAAMATSFDTIIPSILVGNKKNPDGGGAYDWLVSYLKTFEVWKPSNGMSTGVSQQITQGVAKVASRAGDYRTLITDDATVLLLASGLCTDSILFCNEFVQFINTQHEELAKVTRFDSLTVWQMQLECIQKIVEELSEAREPVSDAARHDPAYYLWGMLRAWQIQQRYRENHFKDDPALTGILVRRIIMRGDGVDLAQKWAKVESLVLKVEEHNRNHNSAIAKLQAALAKLQKP